MSNPASSSDKWVPGETMCFSKYDEDCQELEYFTQEPMNSEEFKDKLIKLRFALPRKGAKTERGIQRVTECYDIDSLFRYVFQQIFENRPEIVTPTKKALSPAQIARIRRCYFGQDESEREWDNIQAFNAEMTQRARQRVLEERQQLLELYSQATDSDNDADSLDFVIEPDLDFFAHYVEATRWLDEQFPVLQVELPELVPDIYLDMMRWLDTNGLLRFDRYTFEEILADPETAQEIREYLTSQYADLEEDEDVNNEESQDERLGFP